MQSCSYGKTSDWRTQWITLSVLTVLKCLSYEASLFIFILILIFILLCLIFFKNKNLALIATGTGLFFSVIFHLGVPEPKRMEDELRKVTDEDGMASVERSMLLHDRKRTICSWFKDIRFYQVYSLKNLIHITHM